MSKAFGEAVAALYAFKHGLRVTCLRIGNVTDTPADRRRLSIWVAPQDLAQLIRIGLEHPDIRYEIFFGASDNARTFWDNEAAFRFGYRPQCKAEDYRDAALAAQAKLPSDPIAEWYQGGPFCSEEYDAKGELSPA
jgi:uronate dehydrogenase